MGFIFFQRVDAKCSNFWVTSKSLRTRITGQELEKDVKGNFLTRWKLGSWSKNTSETPFIQNVLDRHIPNISKPMVVWGNKYPNKKSILTVDNNFEKISKFPTIVSPDYKRDFLILFGPKSTMPLFHNEQSWGHFVFSYALMIWVGTVKAQWQRTIELW